MTAHDRPPLAEAARILKLTPARWTELAAEPWTPPAVILGGAWLLMAWSRLGLQGLTVPRIVVRYLLVGFYGWVGMVATILAVWWVLQRRSAPGSGTGTATGPAGAEGVGRRLDAVAVARVVARAHQPLVFLGFAVQLTQVVPFTVVSQIGAGFVFGFWMPGLLLVGSAAVNGLPTRRLAVPVAAAYGLWLATVGGYLFRQLGHLL